MYRKTTLDNGIRILTDAMPSVRSVAIGIVVDVSPRHEIGHKRGLAHMTEHLVFQGTSSRSALQIARMMDTAGGNMGAFTARDYTCYYATVLDEYRTYALDLLGDMLLNSLFPEASLAREQEAVLRELDGTGDDPEQRAHTLLKTVAWPDHPVGWSIIGEPEHVRAMSREDVIYFMHEHYTPDSVIITAAGHVDHDDFVAQVQDAFWRMQGQRTVVEHPLPKYQPGVTVSPMPVSQAYFAMGLPAYPYAHPDRYALHMLNNILGGGISSRLFCRIREERGLVYDIGSEYHAYHDAGMLVITGSTAPESLMQVVALTLVELWKLASGDEPVDMEELWKAKMHLRGQHLISAEDTHTRMSRLATQELYFGRHIATEEILAHIDAIDASLLGHMGETFLQNALNQVSLVVVGPEAPEHYSATALEELIAGC